MDISEEKPDQLFHTDTPYNMITMGQIGGKGFRSDIVRISILGSYLESILVNKSKIDIYSLGKLQTESTPSLSLGIDILPYTSSTFEYITTVDSAEENAYLQDIQDLNKNTEFKEILVGIPKDLPISTAIQNESYMAFIKGQRFLKQIHTHDF